MAAAAQLLAVRRDWLRWPALAWGVTVLIGHVTTWHDMVSSLDLPPDLVQHLTGVGLLTLLYRASWGRGAPGNGLSPNLAALLVCSGWGALCECLQLFIPLRDFDLRELALNTLVPAALIGLWWLVEQVWE